MLLCSETSPPEKQELVEMQQYYSNRKKRDPTPKFLPRVDAQKATGGEKGNVFLFQETNEIRAFGREAQEPIGAGRIMKRHTPISTRRRPGGDTKETSGRSPQKTQEHNEEIKINLAYRGVGKNQQL